MKYLISFDIRFWESLTSSPTFSEDGPVNLTWETTEEDKTPEFVFVVFSGARNSDQCVAWPQEQRERNYMDALRDPYPSIDQRVRGTKFMNWPQERWTLASYYFPRPNEVTTWGPLWRAGCDGWFHFAGGHTCYAFMGYMKGTLASGYQLARRLAIREQVVFA